jgi:hypothetical protein
MDSATLRLVLHRFATEVADALDGARAGGEEIDFEVIDEGAHRSGPSLYCYRPLIGEFIARHWSALMELPAARAALAAANSLPRLAEYVETHAGELPGGGVQRLPEAALRCFIGRIYVGSSESFVLTPERFDPAWQELGTDEQAGRDGHVVLGLLRGVRAESDEIELGEGMLLARVDRLEALPPDPTWLREDASGLVVAIEAADGPGGVTEALERLCDLQSALALYASGVALAPLAWAYGHGATWRPLPLRRSGRAGGTLVLGAEQEGELRAFADLLARRRPNEGELAWALERFELGCERADPLGGLTDHLLALRALLEPEGPRSGRLAGRVAALCALPEDRAAMTERIARAISLEQALIAGVGTHGDALSLATEIEERLRALLRDVLCGYLSADLVSLADAHIFVPAPEGDEVRITRTPAASPAAPVEDEWGFSSAQAELGVF